MTTKQYSIRGGIVGTMWWPQDLGIMQIQKRIERDQAIDDEIAYILSTNSGDFQGMGLLTGDSEIVIEEVSSIRNGNVTRTRYVPVVALPSLAEYVNESIYSHDFDPEY